MKMNFVGAGLSVLFEDQASCAILIFLKSVVIFADFVLISGKMTTILKEIRISPLST